MASISSVETGRLVVGECLIPPIASIEAWPSFDPQSIASFHNLGLHLGEGIQNQSGILNTLGLDSCIGALSRTGFSAAVGGQVHAQPVLNDAAITMAFSSPSIIQTTPLDSKKLTQNGTPVELASDIKLKRNIKPLENSLDKVLQMNGVEYDRNDIDWHEIGFIAQQVEDVVPDLVRVDNEGTKLVQYKNVTALLVEAIKEQQEQINQLKETVQELSTKLADCCS